MYQTISGPVCFPLCVCAELPLPSASVDAVICDLPFGRKFGTKANMAANLSLILTEMERLVPVCVSMVHLDRFSLVCLCLFVCVRELCRTLGPLKFRCTSEYFLNYIKYKYYILSCYF